MGLWTKYTLEVIQKGRTEERAREAIRMRGVLGSKFGVHGDGSFPSREPPKEGLDVMVAAGERGAREVMFGVEAFKEAEGDLIPFQSAFGEAREGFAEQEGGEGILP